MRAPLLLPLSIALLSAFPALAQDAPRVLFCSGPCFAVDANGVRTPAPKGTVLRPNQRFETGAGGYAQIKLAPGAAMALGDSARVRIDQTRLQEPMIVNLDLGRARMLLREVGKPVRPIELHTVDGKFVLRDADVEIKKSQIASVGSNLTVVKVNAGDAMLRAPQGDIPVGKGDVQGIEGGKVLRQPISRTEIALTPPPTKAATPAPITEPVVRVPLPDIVARPPVRGELPPIAQLPNIPITVYDPRTLTQPTKPPLTKSSTMLSDRVLTPDGIKTLDAALFDLAMSKPAATVGTTVDRTITIIDSASVTISLVSPVATVPFVLSAETIVKTPTETTTTTIAPTNLAPISTSSTTATLTNTTTVTTINTITATPTTTTTTTILTQPILLQPILGR